MTEIRRLKTIVEAYSPVSEQSGIVITVKIWADLLKSKGNNII